MRKEINKDGDTYKCWLSQEEIEQIANYTDDLKNEFIIRMLGNVGLRVGEVNNIRYKDIYMAGDDEYMMEITGAKDTTGEYKNGKSRTVYIPSEIDKLGLKLMYEHDKNEDDELIDISTRAIQYRIDNIMSDYADKYGDEYKYVSAHDFRRSYVTHQIHTRNIDLTIIKHQMGWKSIETARHYLDKPTEQNIIDSFK